MEKWQRALNKQHIWAGIIVTGLLMAICYGFALRLPFFFDDLPIMTWLSQHNMIEIWTLSSENDYYRPLAFTIYKLGHLLPRGGPRQVALHAVNLAVHWAGALLIMLVVKMVGKSPIQALLASILFVVFPFVFLAVPWITALSHPLVTALTLLAVYAALRAERDESTAWWAVSLLATALAPFAHESGPTCSVIVAGLVVVQRGLRSRRRVVGIVLGGLINVAGVLVRGLIPGVREMDMAGLPFLTQNVLWFLHGLLYPVAPVIGWLALHHGLQDFTLVKVATAVLALLLIWLIRRSRDWRWVAGSLWWWAWAGLPAALFINYGNLYISPRLYSLASAGIVMLWAGIIVELGKLARKPWARRLIWLILAGAIVTQNVAFLARQRALFTMLNTVYQRALQAAEDDENVPLGFVNLPRSLGWQEKTYAMILETVLFVPFYSDVGEFIEINQQWRPASAVMYSPVLQDTKQFWGFQGYGVTWEEMRHFAIDRGSVWRARYHDERFVLNRAGNVTADARPLAREPLVRFEGGPVIESAAVHRTPNGHWALTLNWLASGPLDAEIFVHVLDAQGNLVTQADGPALERMVPLWLWQPGDRIQDVRHLMDLRRGGPYTVQIGIYTGDGRFPAFMGDARCPDDAAPVATIGP